MPSAPAGRGTNTHPSAHRKAVKGSGQQENQAKNCWGAGAAQREGGCSPCPQQAADTRELQTVPAAPGEGPCVSRALQDRSHLHSDCSHHVQHNAILVLGYWQKSELRRSEGQTWLTHSFHAEFDFPTQTPAHTEPQTQTLPPLKDSAPAQQTHHLLSCWDVGLQPGREPCTCSATWSLSFN